MQALAAEWPGFARPFCCFLKGKFNPNPEVERSSFVLVVVVLENSDISPSYKRNKIIARKFGFFLGAEAQ
jgi:hypothetical protein